MKSEHNDITEYLIDASPSKVVDEKTNYNNPDIPLTSVDSIKLYTTRDAQSWDTVNYRYQVLPGFTCKRNKLNSNYYTYEISSTRSSKAFLRIARKKGLKGKAADYPLMYVDLHLNNFLYECFPSETISEATLTNKLNEVIRHFTKLKLFDIERLKISRVDISCDIRLDYSVKPYLDLIYNINFPRYYLLKNQGNTTLSVHKRGDLYQIESDTDSERLAVIYNKSQQYLDVHNIELPRNIMRMECKFKGKKKNHIELANTNSKGIKRFSDIFRAKLSKALYKDMLSNWLLIYDGKNILEMRKSKRDKTLQKYLTRFNNQDQFRQEYLALKFSSSTQSQKNTLARDFKNYKEYHFIKESLKEFESGIKFGLYKELCRKINNLNIEQVNSQALNTYRLLQNSLDIEN
ncbi:hypothetical protein IQ255_27790 [Pleurocapsales cyanobacterium LEGE 10410]|nr:hypothetical protein [Pleurocapsales cyanobacterium LEGE 10410]